MLLTHETSCTIRAHSGITTWRVRTIDQGYDNNRSRYNIEVTVASPLNLPPMPPRWQGRFHSYHSLKWCGWIANSYWSDNLQEQLQCPEALFSEQNLISWYKQGRNRLAIVHWPTIPNTGLQVVLKAYGTGDWHTRLRMLFRPSRAMRHWQRAAELQGRGIRTPQPVWLAVPQGRQYKVVYLAVESAPPHLRLRELLRAIGPETAEIDFSGHKLAVSDLVTALGHYARDLHEAGVAHRDFSGGNILIPENWNGNSEGLLNEFILLDINRARLFAPGTIDIYHRIQDLERISLVESQQQHFYAAYADGSAELLAQWPRYQRYRHSYLRMRNTQNPLWRFVLKTSTYWIRTG